MDKFFDLVIQHKMYSKRRNLIHHLAFMYGGDDLAGKRVLDVGGGDGLLTFFAAAQGAEAICLEPEFDGSRAGMIDRFHHFKTLLSNHGGKSSLQTATFQEFSEPVDFDIIILANSINHLDEPACERLHLDQSARDTYLGYFRKMYAILRPGGRIIMTDCDRTNFFNQLGLTSPFMKTIEWHKHQSPRFWIGLLQEAGFQPISISWSAPNALGKLGRFLLGNRLIAYFLLSHFRLVVRKPS